MAAYRYLCARLGRGVRLSLNVPRIQDGPSDVTVRWRCGCLAAGQDLKRVTLHPCPAHVALMSDYDVLPSEPGDAELSELLRTH